MSERIFRTTTRIALPLDVVFAFFSDATNLEKITPPELRFRIVSPKPVTISEGALIEYRLRLFGVPFGWSTLISRWKPPHEFVDEQLKGPYKQWIHTHRFSSVGSETLMEDTVRYVIPLGPLGNLVAPLVALQIRRIFEYRESVIRTLLKGVSTPATEVV